MNKPPLLTDEEIDNTWDVTPEKTFEVIGITDEIIESMSKGIIKGARLIAQAQYNICMGWHLKEVAEIKREIEQGLDLEDETYIRISNHIPYSWWQAFWSKYTGGE